LEDQEALARAAVTVETERIKVSNPWCLMMMMMMMIKKSNEREDGS
jgi:hypothetical protein